MPYIYDALHPLEVHEKTSLILFISLLFGSISSIAIVVSALFAYLEWKRTRFENKVNLVEKIREQLFNDNDVLKVIYLMDYNDLNWYNEIFHYKKDLQMAVDKTLSIIEYVCYLKNEKILGE